MSCGFPLFGLQSNNEVEIVLSNNEVEIVLSNKAVSVLQIC